MSTSKSSQPPNKPKDKESSLETNEQKALSYPSTTPQTIKEEKKRTKKTTKTRLSKKRTSKTTKKTKLKETTLTVKQQRVFDFIKQWIDEKGFSPTHREIGNHLGITSTNGVSDHIKMLQRKGFLEKTALQARSIVLTETAKKIKRQGRKFLPLEVRKIPLLGKVAAGEPIPRIEENDKYTYIDSNLIGHSNDEVFALTVQGESMIEAGIYENDKVFVRRQKTANNGDIVVIVIDNEVTMKRFFIEDERVRLQPANATMQPIYLKLDVWHSVEILGIIIGLTRKF